jgi:hypothetical protein
MNPNIPEIWVEWKPGLRPEIFLHRLETPCLLRPSTQTMNKNKVNQRFGRLKE